MNLLDLVIVGLGISAAFGGHRLGLVARLFSWAGMGLGIVVTARFLPDVVEAVSGSDPSGRLLVAIGVLLGGAFVGQALGLLIGSKLHLALPRAGRPLDRAGGAVAGVFGVLATVWLLAPAMADVPGEFARQARNSTIVRGVTDAAPPPPDALQTLRGLVGESQFPRVFDALRPAPNVGPPPVESGLAPGTLQAVASSTVKIEGPACGRIQEGSGFVAEEGVVVTNAHVVAGERSTTVLERSGRRVPARVVHFDADRDLAVLVADVRPPPLPIRRGGVGTQGGVLGYPGGGDLEVSPFEIEDAVTAVGRDLYDRRATRRQVYVLASDLHPGDSGAPLVDRQGAVVGVAFAIAPDRPGTAYALQDTEVRAALAAPRRPQASTGPCIS